MDGGNHYSLARAEFVSKLGDCLKELEESAYWLELLLEIACVSAPKLAALQNETGELLAIFTTISKKTKAGTTPPHNS
jgi:four helix bundle protein